MEYTIQSHGHWILKKEHLCSSLAFCGLIVADIFNVHLKDRLSAWGRSLCIIHVCIDKYSLMVARFAGKKNELSELAAAFPLFSSKKSQNSTLSDIF